MSSSGSVSASVSEGGTSRNAPTSWTRLPAAVGRLARSIAAPLAKASFAASTVNKRAPSTVSTPAATLRWPKGRVPGTRWKRRRARSWGRFRGSWRSSIAGGKRGEGSLGGREDREVLDVDVRAESRSVDQLDERRHAALEGVDGVQQDVGDTVQDVEAAVVGLRVLVDDPPLVDGDEVGEARHLERVAGGGDEGAEAGEEIGVVPRRR